MRKISFLIILLAAAVMSVAAPVKASKSGWLTAGSASVLGAVESRSLFDGDRLFAVLDSVGGSGTWMEWDVNGVKDPSVMDVLNPLLKSSNKPKMVWILTERDGENRKPLMAVLLPKGAGETIVFYELKDLDAKPVDLAINGVLDPLVVLRDYRQVNDNEFVHRDQPNLKAYVTRNTIRLSYEKKGENPLILDPEFSKKNMVEKRVILRDFDDYFKYEYSLMLRAFVQSTRSIFNWQAWHWYMPSWNGKFMMKQDELEAILSRGITPEFFVLFRATTPKGESVELRTNGSGLSILEIKTKK
ncbi:MULTISPECIES: hypothetical protein [unclassified Fibrobacter]|uniref:hypothetical protein n=1 Tax=unclassified Fibrobacter TaxID=2634177 RepID=UPI000D6ABDB6|nr:MULTISPECIES: hypothetical protein [unclassified Fibrobacter]PWJ62085.1 hypothetical protein BGX12_12316 [Fibrobacter sp. UWR4]PZW67482.1 hypothetical protein C8E88_102319 [Fibrobacter sp. UWR1]